MTDSAEPSAVDCTISTHTPLAGRDWVSPDKYLDYLISTHTPLAGRDKEFYPQHRSDEISTHTPLAGRDQAAYPNYKPQDISTHTPLAGRDWNILQPGTPQCEFLLTRPLRDVTQCLRRFRRALDISTHTPLAGRDHTDFGTVPCCRDFYSHAPCGT